MAAVMGTGAGKAECRREPDQRLLSDQECDLGWGWHLATLPLDCVSKGSGVSCFMPLNDHPSTVLFLEFLQKVPAYEIRVKYYFCLPAGDPGHPEWSCGCSQIL